MPDIQKRGQGSEYILSWAVGDRRLTTKDWDIAPAHQYAENRIMKHILKRYEVRGSIRETFSLEYLKEFFDEMRRVEAELWKKW